MERNGRIKELDYLRGLAALSIVGYHYTTRYCELFGGDCGISLPWGFMSVAVFFVLSGYLTVHNATQHTQPSAFLVKRFSRLYPAFLVCATITFFVTRWLLPDRGVSWVDYFGNFTMIPDLLSFAPVDGAYWTLLYELFFYVYFAAVLVFGLIKFKDWICLVYVAILFVAYFITDSFPVMSKVNVLLLSGYGQMFAVGGALASVTDSAVSNGKWISGVTILLALGYTALALNVTYAVFLLLIVVLVVGAIILHSRNISIPTVGWVCKPLIKVAKISYPLYLVHQNVGYAIMRTLQYEGISYWSSAIIALTVSIIAAYLIHRFVEIPCGKMIMRLYNKRKSQKSVST